MTKSCPFCAIINGEEAGRVISEDNEEFLLIQDAHPEGAIHWLASPRTHIESIEEMEEKHSAKFIRLVQFAVEQTKNQVGAYPLLENGFTIKFHFGPFESIAHAKLHILSTE